MVDRSQDFELIAKKMCEVYKSKNKDYGDSFGETFKEVGIISAYVRISDKFNRLKGAVVKGHKFNYEGLMDTLLDLASYCIMTVIALRHSGEEKSGKTSDFAKTLDGGKINAAK
jgi:hypothetical protein